jgi:hypothetical protein
MYCRLNDAASLYDDTTDLDTAIQSLTDVRTCADVACPFVAKDGVYYTLEVTVSGNVRSAVPGGNACEPLDRCIRDATRKTQLPRPKSPGTVRVYCTIHA